MQHKKSVRRKQIQMKIMQYEQSAIWKQHNMEIVLHKKDYNTKKPTWKWCSMETFQYKKSVT